MIQALERVRGRLTPRQQVVLGAGVTLLGCGVAYVLGVFAMVAGFDDIDHPTDGVPALQWALGAAALAVFIASGPVGYFVGRRRPLLWGPMVAVVLPLVGWGVFGLLN